MPTKNPRLNVVVEAPLYRTIQRLAKKNGLSMSLEARELLCEAIEISEDAYWVEKAHLRWKTLNHRQGLSHAQVWSRKRR